MMKRPIRRKTLFVLLVFGGLTAVAGGIGLLTGGSPASPDWLQGSPFHDGQIGTFPVMDVATFADALLHANPWTVDGS